MTNIPAYTPIEPYRLSVILRVDKHRDVVFARFRPFPSRGRPDITGRLFSTYVSPPPDMDVRKWKWALGLAASRFNTVDVPDDFYEVPGTLRNPILIRSVQELAERYAQHPDRH